MLLGAFLTTLGAIVMIAVSFLLIGLILLQKNRGSGLSGAFGGVGGHSAFGTKTGDFLTWVTVGLTTVFLVLAILLNFGFTPAKPAEASSAGATPTPAAPVPGEQPPVAPANAPVRLPTPGTSPLPMPMSPAMPPSQVPSPAPATPANPPTAPTGG